MSELDETGIIFDAAQQVRVQALRLAQEMARPGVGARVEVTDLVDLARWIVSGADPMEGYRPRPQAEQWALVTVAYDTDEQPIMTSYHPGEDAAWETLRLNFASDLPPLGDGPNDSTRSDIELALAGNSMAWLIEQIPPLPST